MLILTGVIGVFLQVINLQRRKQLLLGAPPGSIATAIALTSRSGFGELLLPYDDEVTLQKKLEGLRFRLDKRTGAIIAEAETEKPQDTLSDEVSLRLSLLKKETSISSMSSSDLAYATASGTI